MIFAVRDSPEKIIGAMSNLRYALNTTRIADFFISVDTREEVKLLASVGHRSQCPRLPSPGSAHFCV